MNFLFLAQAGGNNLMLILLFIVLIAFTYFGMIRPQRKQQQKRLQMMDRLKKGDQVVLVDGLHGKIDAINAKDKTVVVDADGIYLTFSRMAVRQIVPAKKTTAKKAEAATASSQPASKDKTAKPEDTNEQARPSKKSAPKEDANASDKTESEK